MAEAALAEQNIDFSFYGFDDQIPPPPLPPKGYGLDEVTSRVPSSIALDEVPASNEIINDNQSLESESTQEPQKRKAKCKRSTKEINDVYVELRSEFHRNIWK